MSNSSTFSRVQVLDRALDLMELMAVSQNGLSIADMSAATGLPKSTIHRILATFLERHYVRKDPDTSIYSIGYRFVEISSIYLNTIDLKLEAGLFMHNLANRFGATCYLAVLENSDVVYLERVEQYSNIRLYTQIGKREPAYCTGLGKIMLAALPQEECDKICKNLSYIPYTPNSVKSYEQLRPQLQFAREHGYALDHEEHTLGSSCIAVPIYDYSRQVIAAMSLNGPDLLKRFPPEKLYEELKKESMELSRIMGYTPEN